MNVKIYKDCGKLGKCYVLNAKKFTFAPEMAKVFKNEQAAKDFIAKNQYQGYGIGPSCLIEVI